MIVSRAARRSRRGDGCGESVRQQPASQSFAGRRCSVSRDCVLHRAVLLSRRSLERRRGRENAVHRRAVEGTTRDQSVITGGD